MWGTVIGDIAGSRFEGGRGRTKDFELFHQQCRYTDDTVCTAAVAHIVVNEQRPDHTLQQWCRRHPGRGYGGGFAWWIASSPPRPYGSFGNGAAMRVSPVALHYRDRPLAEALAASDQVTEITHDHPQGIKGARAITKALWLALRGNGPETIRSEIARRYGYDLDTTVDAIRPTHRFDVTCQGTVPTALVCALESTSLEDAVRNAVSLGGDADTLAAIAGALGEALHGLPGELVETVRTRYLQGAEDITRALDALYANAPRSEVSAIPEGVLSRAQGCLLGQLAGDSLGSLVEFSDAATIRAQYPQGVHELADGGVWGTIAGQPTDDSEMALALARSLVRNQGFSIEDVRASYVRWSTSDPFDIGHTTRCGLDGHPMRASQGNGALMRISPLGIFGWTMQPRALAKCAAADAALTHPNETRRCSSSARPASNAR